MVLGLNGIIGWNLFKLARKEAEAFGTYRRLHEGLDLTRCHRVDLLDTRAFTALLKKIKPDYLIHAWAMCDLDVCEEEPAIARRVNVEGTRSIVQAAADSGTVKKIVYVSTDHVFDGLQGGYSEEDLPCPIHVYGRTKIEAESIVKQSGLPWMIIRPGLVIGESLQRSKGPRDFLMKRIVLGKPTHYFTDEFRSPVRGDDFARAALKIALSPLEGVFHVAGKGIFSRYNLARKIAWENRLPVDMIFPRMRKHDRWASIRPENLTLRSGKIPLLAYL